MFIGIDRAGGDHGAKDDRTRADGHFRNRCSGFRRAAAIGRITRVRERKEFFAGVCMTRVLGRDAWLSVALTR